ncbi:N-6 DNA methylase [Nocardioides sp. HDW12B]|uniref:N-6 DNA methylase n=1 Tax=Nocardioides sp. HDW12B TaxID=2714939 RepID=UPI00140C2D54|nr:N-6 DNA methylase [Nocardioides sp. HDW12B]QIK66832.1 N-6 DNA methylase [Nocardioides sp. HDW12B]
MAASLDGQASSELRRLVPAATRRANGAFFTASHVRAQFADAVREHGVEPYFDPACGAGDLLLTAATTLEAHDTTVGTMAMWSSQLRGRDITNSFVSAARLRLQLAALARHGLCQTKLSQQFFRGVSVGDGTRAMALATQPGTLLINPPFGRQHAPADCTWGSGSVPRAAIFLESALRNVAAGSKVVAILPDVLRSGSNSARFRRVIDGLMAVEEVIPVGQFDRWTDVDVFILVGTRTQSGGHSIVETSTPVANTWLTKSPPGGSLRVGDFFEVRVGPVVQTRDPRLGPERPFLMAHELPQSGTVTKAAQRRPYAGRVFDPPFVVVRRTDRPSTHGRRAVAVTVDGDEATAVENHLLVLRPFDGSARTCRELASWLSGPEVRSYLDSRINCRHLTTAALSEAPLPAHWVKPDAYSELVTT